jgi:beta-carotene hydroxylase
MTEAAVIERGVLMDVRRFQVDFAWPTIALALAIFIGYCLVIVATVMSLLPLGLAFFTNSFLSYLAYTPLHEGAHGNVATDRYKWINRAVGIIGSILLLHNFTMHRTTHLAHHANLNDPEKDADHWVAGLHWWSILFRCFTLVFSHYAMGIRLNGRRVILTALIENLLPVAAFVAVGLGAGWQIALFTMLLPALAGATLLGLLFDYAVHAPHSRSGRFTTTRLFLFPRGLRRIGSALWVGQNYHLIHHLYPWLPFYRYAAAYRAARPLLTARNASIVTL